MKLLGAVCAATACGLALPASAAASPAALAMWNGAVQQIRDADQLHLEVDASGGQRITVDQFADGGQRQVRLLDGAALSETVILWSGRLRPAAAPVLSGVFRRRAPAQCFDRYGFASPYLTATTPFGAFLSADERNNETPPALRSREVRRVKNKKRGVRIRARRTVDGRDVTATMTVAAGGQPKRLAVDGGSRLTTTFSFVSEWQPTPPGLVC